MYRTTLATILSPLIGGKLVDLMQDPGVVIDSRDGPWGSTTHEDIIDGDTSSHFEAYNGNIGDWLSV